MSLLKGKQDGLIFEYQLPLTFEDQLETLDKYVECLNGAKLKYSKLWNMIKDNITIYEDLDGKEKKVWSKGGQIEETPFMLGYSKSACEFFSNKLNVFFKERKVM